MLKQLKLEKLGELDEGRVLETWEQAQNRMLADIEDRPGVPKPRVTILEQHTWPVCDETGHLIETRVQFKVKEKFPDRVTDGQGYSTQIRHDTHPTRPGVQRMLIFNDMSDDNIHQRTLDELEPDA